MRNLCLIVSLTAIFNTLCVSQNLSFKVGYDYWQTHLERTELFSSNIRIGGHSSTYGYRAMFSYELPVMKSWYVGSDIGFSQGGFDLYQHTSSIKINQIFVSLAPQYHVNKWIKVHLGGLLHYNFRKEKTLSEHVSNLNGGVCGGVSVYHKKIELGVRYTKYLNPYYDYDKIYSLANGEKQYWNVMGVFLGYRFWQKSKH